MKKRWMRRVSVILVLCLLFNDNLTDISLRTQAVESDTPVASFGVPESVSDGDVVSPEDTVSDGDAKVEIPEEKRENEIEKIAFPVEVVGDDIPIVMADNQYTMPGDLESYQEAVASGKTEFFIATTQDYIDAQNLSGYPEVNGFAGVTLTILEPSNADRTWDIGSISGFTGIGTAENPFRGTLRCYYENGDGVRFALDKPLLAYMGDGAVFDQFDMTTNASCAAIAGHISGNVTISDVWVQGTIGNGTGTVGPVAAEIASNSNVSVNGMVVSGGALTVSGTIAGGLAGSIGDNVVIDLAENVNLGKSAQTAVLGKEAAGSFFGVVKGSHIWNLADLNYVNARAIADNNNCYAGMFAGQLINENGSGTLTVTGGTTLKSSVSGAGNCGGLIGLCGEATNIVLTEGSLTISGTVDSTTGRSGGVVGVIVDSQMELSDYTITARVGGAYAGGIVGQIQGGKYIIRDVNVAEVTGPTATGGVVAEVTNSAAIELQGMITLTSVSPHGNGKNGYVVGRQENSLIYLSEHEGLLNGVSQLSYLYDNREDIGTYGGLYRNQNIAGGKLIGDGTLAQVGVINNTVAKDGDWYQLTSAADFETLAIVLGTEGNFGSDAFGGASWSDLLKASYTVTKNVDISYDKTGIITLNRSDKPRNATYAFDGIMQGANNTVTITQNIDVVHQHGGLFNTLTGTVEFKNLIIDGTVRNVEYAGGIASQITNGQRVAFTNVTVKKKFVDNKNYIGGFVGQQIQSNNLELVAKDITLACEMDMGNNQKFSGFIAQIAKANVDIDGVTLAGSVKSQTGTGIGGFFGHTWKNTAGIAKNITVEPGTVYSCSGVFGVLWLNLETQSNNYLTLDTIKLNGLTVTGRADKSLNCSLLIQTATNVILNIIDYDSTGCTVNGVGNNFDEVAGITRNNPNPYGGDTPLPGNSGIVSLHSRVANFPEYHYENRATYGTYSPRTSFNTVYYYDVFQRLENPDGSLVQIDYNVIDTPEKMLLWNVLQMAPGSLRDTFKPYFVNGTYQLAHAQTYYFKGTLDLSDISFYPTPGVDNGTYIGQDNAKIIFGAKTNSVDMGAWTFSNEQICGPHYGLHGGLLYNEFGNMYLNVSDITFSGTIANMPYRSGALAAGEHGVADGGVFRNITLDNLWVADYDKNAVEAAYVGLLICKLPANTATFNGIRMVNYPADNGGKKAASSLITYAGGIGVTNMVLNFSNMVIADEVAGNNHNGDVLANASFIYEYNYTDNTEINTGSGIYLFTQKNAEDGMVTYGLELDETTEFSDNSNTVLSTMGISNTDYIPYVYQYETIEVNPKAGDILKGCGTYDDPYVIEDEKQFLTLYRYINERELTDVYPAYQYDSFYKQGGGWQLVALGDDTSFCEEKHVAVWDANTGSYNVEVVAYGDDNFPTPEELSHAYYMLGANLDLTSLTNETYKQIANDFVGFGTDIRPFAGVWYGAGHSITLPQKVDKTYTNYGFIQYAQGAVVKDLTIKAVQGATVEASKAPFVNGSGGGVIATILGGDNIIDNVTVKTDIKLQNQHTPVGGYVGLVKKGGLILRNVETADLSGFRVNYNYSEDVYCLLGAVVGKVEDGYVLYDGAGAGSAVWNGITTLNGYPAAPGYAILNGDTLETSGVVVGAPTTSDNMNYDIAVSIPNAAGLQAMAMALNADALNVKPSDFNDYTACGYTEKSRSRKANYSHIGNCTAETADYIAAAKYDNVMGYSQNGYAAENANKAYAYPYLYDCMGITGDAYLNYWVESDGDGYTVLNPAMPFGTSEGTKLHRITWNLANGGNYDMAQFGDAFRGIGAVYQTGNAHGGTFHGNFDGNGSTIQLSMTRKVLDTEINSTTIPRVGLFNTIYPSYEAMYNIPADFSESASAVEPGDGGDSGDDDEPDVSGDTYNPNAVYTGGDRVVYKGKIYEARWWTQGDIPGESEVWLLISDSGDGGDLGGDDTGGDDGGDDNGDDGGDTGGDSGDSSDIPEWNAGTYYNKGDLVRYNGAVYRSLADNLWYWEPTYPQYWELVTDVASLASMELSGIVEVNYGAGENIINCFEIKDFKLAGSVNGKGQYSVTAGGVVAAIEGANYIFSGISTDSNNPLVVGSANYNESKTSYAGGMIGMVNDNSNVLISNCDFVGTDSNPIRVYAFTNAGGLVGNQGGIWSWSGTQVNLKIEDVQVEHLLVDYVENSAGGLVGHAYAGKTILAGTEDTLVSVTDSTIQGITSGGLVGQVAGVLNANYVSCNDSAVGTNRHVSAAGGIVGATSGNVTISNATCDKLSMISYCNIGGIVGKTTGSSGVSTIKNVAVTDSALEENSNYNGQPEGLGGVVGFNEQTLTIQNANVTGTKTNDTYNFRIKGNEEVRTNIQGVGGIVGCHIASTNKLTLKDCGVNTVDISTDISITDSHKGQMLGAGGIVGFVGGEVVLDPSGAISTENLNVRAPLFSEAADGAAMGAGGAFGLARYQNGQYYGVIWGGDDSTYHNGLIAQNNTVTGKYAGGLMGYSNLVQFRFSGVTVEDGTVTGDDAVGGLIGYFIPHYYGSAFNPNESKVDIEPVNTVSNMKISGKMAGGAFGYLKLHGPMRAESVEIRGNVIQSTVDMSERIAGGVIGVCEATSNHIGSFYDISLMDNIIVAETAGSTVNADEAALLAVGGVVGKTVETTTTGEGKCYFDGIYVENTNQIGVRQVGTDAVKLLKTNGNGYLLSDIEMPATGEATATDLLALEALEQNFGYGIGSFVGVWNSSTSLQMYILDEKEENGKFVPPVMASNPPVVDVGRTANQGVDDYRQYCHIIYGAENAIASNVETNLADMKAEVEKVESEYTGAETYAELLTEIRVSRTALDLFNVSYKESYQFPGTDLEIEFPMLVYRVENGTLQDVMESVTDVMTNMAGLSSSDVKILNIKSTPKLFDGTNFSTGTSASISATVSDGVATYTMEDYDGVQDDKLTYTELTYTYQEKSDPSGTHKKVFKLPIFVEEPILYSVHSRIMEGKISDVSTIRTNGTSEENNSIIMANDSDYTLLLEYTYGEAREQMVDGVTVDKVFYMEQNGVAKSLPVGTQLLLVDVTGGNKAYYYTVTDEDVSRIYFTDFTDSSGMNPYVNQSINSLPDVTDNGLEYYTDLGGHQLTETAVERYLLTVFSNDNDTKSKVYSIHAGVQIDDESLKARFQLEKDHREETVWNITANPGLTVSLINKGSDTDISGVISKADGLTVKAAFALQAQDVYWAQKSRDDVTVIDSSNSGKYLEVAFYLRDGSGNRVTLPDGTNFSYKLGDGSYSGNRIIPDDTIVYYYKDIRNQFEIDNFEYLINNISQNTTVPVEYFLDFSGADLSTVLDDSYVAWIELLRTANKDYPMGNNNTVDSHSKVINASAMQELGFALRADDLQDLAINTYPVPRQTNNITGHIMFDFSENLKIAGTGLGRDMVLEKWSHLDYQVTYQVYKKTDNGYVKYTGDDIKISALNPATGLEDTGENANLTVTYNFSKSEIVSGNGEEPVEGVLSFPCRITQNTKDLVKETDSLTNYRVEATLTIKEKGVSAEVSEKTTDFFVYTVTKLKFDL